MWRVGGARPSPSAAPQNAGEQMNEVKRVFTSGPGVLLLVAINIMSINSLSPATAKGLFIVFASVELISMLSLWRLDRLPWQR